MAEQNKFGPMPDATRGSGGLRCEEWEALLADALDGLLPARDTVAFEAHSAGCEGCAKGLRCTARRRCRGLVR